MILNTELQWLIYREVSHKKGHTKTTTKLKILEADRANPANNHDIGAEGCLS